MTVERLPRPIDFYATGSPHDTLPRLKGKRPDKRQVMDGDVLIGTIERDRASGGTWAVLEETGEQQWFKTGDGGKAWLRSAHGTIQREAAREHHLSLRHQWDYVS